MLFVALGVVLPWGLHIAPALACLLLMGAGFRKAGLYDSSKNDKWSIINTLVSFGIVFAFGLINPRAGQITGSGQISKILGTVEVVYTIIYGTLCSFFLLNFSKLLTKTGIVGRYLAWCATNSITFFFVHLVYMALVKTIVGADLNPTFAYVSRISGRELLAFALTVVLVSLHTLVANKIMKTVKEHKARKKHKEQERS